MENLELKLLEVLSKLQQYGISTPIDSKNFWKEWQKVFTQVKLSQVAIRSLLGSENLKTEEVDYLKRKLAELKEVENYLREIKEVALQVKGYSFFTTEESEDNDDFDDFLF
jgi:hypothetical protein